jgi:hypothetical protein
MKPHNKIEENIDHIKKCYRYCSDTGKLRTVHHRYKKYIGEIVQGSVSVGGYRMVSLGLPNLVVKEHRVIFILNHGYLPEYIDHIDGDKANNRIENLREATTSQNMANVPKFIGKCEYKGISRHKNGTYISRIRFKGKLLHLGYFKTQEEGARAYDTKARELFGTFASINFN